MSDSRKEGFDLDILEYKQDINSLRANTITAKPVYQERYYAMKYVENESAQHNSEYAYEISIGESFMYDMDVQVYPENCSEVFFAR